jgi:site-specific DNA-methyltransferase (adenine-specific)
MKPTYTYGETRLYTGDCLDVLATLPEKSVDTILTDPPYGLAFMGKHWDDVVPSANVWRAVLRVAKPGALLLAFGGTRTYHRLACAIEDAGWELRDCLMWLYGSGFPRSLDISKALDRAASATREGHEPNPSTDAATSPWRGYGTALKPAWEPILLAMKPLDGTFAENALRHGVAGLHIDGGRINPGQLIGGGGGYKGGALSRHEGWTRPSHLTAKDTASHTSGRWPSNLLLDDGAAAILNEQSGEGISRQGKPRASKQSGKGWGMTATGAEYNDSGGASRFFYVAKASRSERREGNDHPTVKPLALLRYLAALTQTPTGGVILDPFMGSGTTIAGRLALPSGIPRDQPHAQGVSVCLRSIPNHLAVVRAG